MKKQLLCLFVIWAVLLTSVNLSAQTVSKDTATEVNSQKAETTSSDKGQNLKLFSSATAENAVDFEKIENERIKKLSKQKMSGKRKAMWAAVIVGSVVGLFFLIKYAKECEVYEPNCPTDEICPCLRYRERNEDSNSRNLNQRISFSIETPHLVTGKFIQLILSKSHSVCR